MKTVISLYKLGEDSHLLKYVTIFHPGQETNGIEFGFMYTARERQILKSFFIQEQQKHKRIMTERRFIQDGQSHTQNMIREERNKLGLSCAKLRKAKATY